MIKERHEDFQVEEIVNLDIFSAKANVPKGKFAIYLLQKRGIDTIHAALSAEHKLHRRIRFLGLKDARAVTKQYISMLARNDSAGDIRVAENITLHFVCYSSTPLSTRNLAGNRFELVWRGFRAGRETIERGLITVREALDNGELPNFYGFQRFGSRRPISHLIGQKIVEDNLRGAIELCISMPSPDEGGESREFRELCADPSNYRRALRSAPKGLDFERAILLSLIARPDDYISCLRSIPLKLRRFFVNAFQSYVVNLALSRVIERDIPLGVVEKGDLVAHLDDGSIREIARASRRSKVNNKLAAVVPLPGYGFRENMGRMGALIHEILGELNIKHKQFYSKSLPEVSVEGGFRPASLLTKEFSWNGYVENEYLKLMMLLPRGCYATTIMREIIKPSDPIEVGF